MEVHGPSVTKPSPLVSLSLSSPHIPQSFPLPDRLKKLRPLEDEGLKQKHAVILTFEKKFLADHTAYLRCRHRPSLSLTISPLFSSLSLPLVSPYFPASLSLTPTMFVPLSLSPAPLSPDVAPPPLSLFPTVERARDGAKRVK